MQPRDRWRLIRVAATMAVLTLFWLLLSGSLSGLSLAAGLACSLAIGLATYDVFIEDHEVAKRSVFPRVLPSLVFPAVLVVEMYVSSVRTLLSVLTGKVNPRVVHFRSRLRSDLARVVLAEAITFTPGTIALDLDEDHFIVHWLNATTRHSSRAASEVKGNLERAIGRMWV